LAFIKPFGVEKYCEDLNSAMLTCHFKNKYYIPFLSKSILLQKVGAILLSRAGSRSNIFSKVVSGSSPKSGGSETMLFKA
jgi:hypothetical protein